MSSPSFSFCPGPGKSQKLAVMFEDWCGSEERWEKSKLVIQMRQVNKVGRRGSRKWMCRTRGDKGLERVTKGYKGLQGVTRCYRG